MEKNNYAKRFFVIILVIGAVYINIRIIKNYNLFGVFSFFLSVLSIGLYIFAKPLAKYSNEFSSSFNRKNQTTDETPSNFLIYRFYLVALLFYLLTIYISVG